MDIEEIKRYIEVGTGVIEVARDYIPDYYGIVRRTYIRAESIQLDYAVKGNIELNEGETTFYFYYDDFGKMINSAENFLNKPVAEFVNYNKTWNE